MHLNLKVENYLKKCFRPETSLTGIQRLGEGIHGVSYLLRFMNSHEKKRLIMKTLLPAAIAMSWIFQALAP